MASGNLRAELECSVCLNTYTDPVTLKCGHNFCRDCIGHVLDTQEGSGGYSCPECREKFQERPALQRNITLRNIVEKFLSAQPDPEESGVLCTQCYHAPVPAVKSCLLCEASLCDNHLRVHSKSPEHVLCDLTTSLENRKCSIHRELLKYYCTEDSACICVSCSLAGEHRGHQVETLDEASEKKKKKLRNVLQKLMTEREETEKRVQSLEEHRRKVQGEAAGETERVTALLRDLRRRLEDLEKRVLSEISGKAERTSLYVTDMIRELEIKKDELSRKMCHIEELCNMMDPLTVLQESDTGDLCDTEDGDDGDRERHDRLLHDGGDLDVAGMSHTLHTGISDIMSGLNVQEGPGTHVYPHSSRKDKRPITAKPSRTRLRPSPTIQHSHLKTGGHNIEAVRQTSGVSGITDILLDESTAGNNLLISDDRKAASWSVFSQNRPETPESFQGSQALSSRSFSSGRHYWEVDVGGSVLWRVGMCYPSIERRGDQSGIGDNKKSWGMVRWGGNQYSVRHDNNEMVLPGDVPSNRVRIDLDYEAGRISFYDLCDPIRHLHTFTTTFTEPLHAGLYVWGGVMASANLKKKLECSVCLKIFTDPITLRCGHNVCQDCIGHVLDTQEGSGEYFCPICKDEFQKRPARHNTVENFLSAQPDQKESEVLCTQCYHAPVPAVKSCLMCEASLCENHLRIHSKSPEHTLCDPTTSLENRKCSVHRELLKYYCTEDSACICVSCRLDGEHRGHQVETLDEASEKKKKKLRNVLQKLMTKKEETEKRVQSFSHIMSGVNVQEGPGTHVYPHSSTKDKGHIEAELSRPRPQPSPTVQQSHLQAEGSNIGAVQETSGVSGVTDILLDVSTASNNLRISDDRKTASYSSYLNRPETPERFQCPQVLSSQSFSSGRHYWEVDVGRSTSWIVGMCYPSIKRRGDQSEIGDNKKSWSLERKRFKKCSVLHDNNEIPLPEKLSNCTETGNLEESTDTVHTGNLACMLERTGAKMQRNDWEGLLRDILEAVTMSNTSLVNLTSTVQGLEEEVMRIRHDIQRIRDGTAALEGGVINVEDDMKPVHREVRLNSLTVQQHGARTEDLEHRLRRSAGLEPLSEERESTDTNTRHTAPDSSTITPGTPQVNLWGNSSESSTPITIHDDSPLHEEAIDLLPEDSRSAS
ncbi:PREDICTED: E3 ubiquitin/ISG15 ligase TRIM25-like [Nanorana parkeri]|uniref:E3 ubiquitin/ISG15 ligase TRIM25-like n=1 Tax=Nanorana parkeri TaxID=125878 RepID=UPI000854B266|nr:PREDICTED: E3 ubiquitin/ISG15 ligase TRIM25-like [Nanorana parkeri]